jgi:sporulation protein YabP
MMNNPAPEKPKARLHTIVMENRRKASITGVSDVASFHDQEIVLRTEDGEVVLVGEQLHISNLSLDEGKLVVEGLIGGLEYSDAPADTKAGFFKRILR